MSKRVAWKQIATADSNLCSLRVDYGYVVCVVRGCNRYHIVLRELVYLNSIRCGRSRVLIAMI